MTFLLSTSKDWRTISNMIKSLLKSKTVTQIKRLQYVKDYSLWENWKIQKKEEKLLFIKLEDTKKQKLTA